MNTTTQLTQALDLTPNEILIFEGFVKNPGVSAAKMSSLLHMDKSSAYRSVNNLVAYNLLLTTPKGDTMTYTPAAPEELHDRFQEKITQLQNLQPMLESFIGSLTAASRRKTHIRTEFGIPAVEKAITESLNCNEKLIRELYRTHSYFKSKAHVNFVLNALKQRVANGVAVRQFFATNPTDEDPEISKIMKNDPKLRKEVRTLPSGLDDMNSIRIWDDTTNFYSEDEAGNVVVITITDKYITSFMKKIYDFIWINSK